MNPSPRGCLAWALIPYAVLAGAFQAGGASAIACLHGGDYPPDRVGAVLLAGFLVGVLYAPVAVTLVAMAGHLLHAERAAGRRASRMLGRLLAARHDGGPIPGEVAR